MSTENDVGEAASSEEDGLPYPETMMKGGDGFGSCSEFKRDLLWTILRLGGIPQVAGTGSAPHGLAIKEELGRIYGEDVNHGRMYPNLDELVGMGMVDKGALDKRTNAYSVTEYGLEQIDQYIDFVKSGTSNGVDVAESLADA